MENNRFGQFGDGVFTTLLCFEKKFLSVDLHYNRLSLGCQFLGLDFPFSSQQHFKSYLTEHIMETTTVVKMIISAKETDHLYLRKSKESFLVLQKRELTQNLFDMQTHGIHLSVSSLNYVPPLDDVSFLKFSSYQPWSIIRNQSPYGLDTIAVHGREILEATCGSLLIQKNDEIISNLTKSNILHSVTVSTFFEHCKQNKCIVRHQPITLSDLYESDSVYYANAANGLLPVHKISFSDKENKYLVNSKLCRDFWKFYISHE